MARYRVTELSYVNDRIVEPGEEVEFVGMPGSNLALIGDEQAARRELLIALRAEARALGIPVDEKLGLPDLSAAIFAHKQSRTA